MHKLRHLTAGLIVLVAFFSLFPMYWMVIGSVKDMSNLFNGIRALIPDGLNFINFQRLFVKNDVLRWFFNSTFIASTATAVVILTNTMAGYSLAKKKFIGKEVIFWVIMGTLMLPRQVLIVPMFILMKQLHLMGSYLSIMLPAIGWPLGIFLIKQFMQTLPTELLESSTIDGCSELGTFFRIVVPLSKPGIGALSIFTFVGVWNDYLWQLVIITKRILVTIPLGVALLQNEFVPDYGILFAGATIAAVPMLVVFLSFQKYFTSGITLGALKG